VELRPELKNSKCAKAKKKSKGKKSKHAHKRAAH
jgi:hypothetical protein